MSSTQTMTVTRSDPMITLSSAGKSQSTMGEGVESNLMGKTAREPAPIRNLYVSTMSYNAFTLTDGALRLIVLLHADSLGFNATQIAIMFALYEVAGVFTNLFGGVAGSKFGLFWTLECSLMLQCSCLGALIAVEPIFGKLDADGITNKTRTNATVYITMFQCLAGVAKDLMKLTGKSAPKLCTKEGAEGRLFQLVSWITGMKNAIKGGGSVLGAVLVGYIGFQWSLGVLMMLLAVFVPIAVVYMDHNLGKQPIVKKINWRGVFRKGRDVNVLSAARFWLFGSRDIWFEIGLPLFLKNCMHWQSTFVGLALGIYIVVYGNLQASTTKMYKKVDGVMGRPQASSVSKWAIGCAFVPGIMGTAMYISYSVYGNQPWTVAFLCAGLLAFAAVFAVNSAIHSYLIVSFSDKDKVSMDLGFYYMANAGGRLVGVLLGGIVYQHTVDTFGLSFVLWMATPFLLLAGAIGSQLSGAAKPVPVKSTAVGDEIELAPSSQNVQKAGENAATV